MKTTNDIPRYRAFEVKFMAQTNTKPSRLRIIDYHYGASKMMSKEFEYRDVYEQAFAYLESIGIKVCGSSCSSKFNDFLLTEDFTTKLQ